MQMFQAEIFQKVIATVRRQWKTTALFCGCCSGLMILYDFIRIFLSDYGEKLQELGTAATVIWSILFDLLPLLGYSILTALLQISCLNRIFSNEYPKHALTASECFLSDERGFRNILLLAAIARIGTLLTAVMEHGMPLLEAAWKYEISGVKFLLSLLITLCVPLTGVVTYFLLPKKIAEYIVMRTKNRAQVLRTDSLLFSYMICAVIFVVISLIAGILPYPWSYLITPFNCMPEFLLTASFYRAYLPPR